MVLKKRSKCCCCKCEVEGGDANDPDRGKCSCGSALWGGADGNTVLADNCKQGTATKGKEIALRDGDQDKCDATGFSYNCARHCCACIQMYKTKDYLSEDRCSYCRYIQMMCQKPML